jgi:hypothetical protein
MALHGGFDPCFHICTFARLSPAPMICLMPSFTTTPSRKNNWANRVTSEKSHQENAKVEHSPIAWHDAADAQMQSPDAMQKNNTSSGALFRFL